MGPRLPRQVQLERVRQVMERDTFEIFHYNNPATCTCPPHQHDFFELF